MTVAVNRSIRIPLHEPAAHAEVEQQRKTPAAPSAPKPKVLRHYAKRVLLFVWHQARSIWFDVLYGTGGGINDQALPSGFAVPYKQGSRGVRNLWHEPF